MLAFLYLLAGKDNGGRYQEAHRQENKGYTPVDIPHVVETEDERQDRPAQEGQGLQETGSRDAVILDKTEKEAGFILAVVILHPEMLEMVEEAAAQGMGNDVARVVAVILEPAAEERVEDMEQEINGAEIDDGFDRLAAYGGVDGFFNKDNGICGQETDRQKGEQEPGYLQTETFQRVQIESDGVLIDSHNRKFKEGAAIYTNSGPSRGIALFLYKGNFAVAHTGPRRALLVLTVLVGGFKHHGPCVSIHLFPP